MRGKLERTVEYSILPLAASRLISFVYVADVCGHARHFDSTTSKGLTPKFKFLFCAHSAVTAEVGWLTYHHLFGAEKCGDDATL